MKINKMHQQQPVPSDAKIRPNIQILTRCRLCKVHCPPNDALWNRDFREKLQDVICEWISVGQNRHGENVCDSCRSTVEEFHLYKKRTREILERKRCGKPMTKGESVQSALDDCTDMVVVPLETLQKMGMMEPELNPEDFINGMPRKQYFKQNRVRHGLRYDVRCYICDAVVARRGFEGHLNQHKEIKPYSCSQCGMHFYCNKNLREHTARIHAECGEISCDVCGEVFNNRIALQSHKIKKHTERRFQCKVCGLKCKFQNILKRHMRVHSAHRDLVCQYCGKTFYRPFVLRIHLRTHTREAPYSCHVCVGRSFVHRRMYVDHMRKDHPGEPIAKLNGRGNLNKGVDLNQDLGSE